MDGMQCLGGNGYINGMYLSFHSCHNVRSSHISDYPMGRFMRDARLYTVGAGTQEIRRMLIGREFNSEFES